jgi:hypothetical protein
MLIEIHATSVGATARKICILDQSTSRMQNNQCGKIGWEIEGTLPQMLLQIYNVVH